ncbi:acyl-CoA dehydrogenase family protein [Novosphingobium sp. KCTC 2891]|uniref:acyl-CoA dehydrogenase family protein n=1 Tax=Novosphingobium sp. KCTC 2891 TaxID=2989730 RepID=UPI002221EAB6|nr:acyl-CoA dehydrogenase family protein [Novosphingobium sp. KCTC 2891]MCW1384119.1 acyl-CoA dehydrogenase family protein [Novosphingobium sp. KCTC 2891]
MNLELDDDLRMLSDSVAGWLKQYLAFDRRRELLGGARQRAFWDEIHGALGLAGAGLPEAWGGFGGGAQSHMVVMDALGGALAPTPYVEGPVIAGTLLGKLGGQDELGKALAAGSVIVLGWEEEQSRGDALSIRTTAILNGTEWHLTGTKRAVRWAEEADTVLVTAQTDKGPAVFRLRGAGSALPLRAYRLIDDHPAADIRLENTPADLVAVGDGVAEAIVAAVDAGTAAICAEATGLMRTMLDDTIDYTKQRKQFGQALASFQVLQHRMVDMRIHIEQSAAAAILAALRGDDSAAVSAAKATIGEAVRYVGQQAVQLHGAMGLTEELRVGHYFRRTTAIENQFGDVDAHVARYRKLRVA